MATCLAALLASPAAAMVAPTWTIQLLHSFSGTDGQNPSGRLARDSAGNLYGTTSAGGAGYGTVFRISKKGVFSTLYQFAGGTDAATPASGLVIDRAGTLYGTGAGGANAMGTVFSVTKTGTETVLHSFTGGSDGSRPGALTVTPAGVVYGTAESGGLGGNGGNGVLFSVSGTTFTTLHQFTGPDGSYPFCKLVLSGGYLWGTAPYGGTYQEGTFFQYSLTTGTLNVLHSFSYHTVDGAFPYAGVIKAAGSWFGNALGGGSDGYGSVFKFTSSGTETVLHNFANGADGAYPEGLLTYGSDGMLYGATNNGGSNTVGTIFAASPAGGATVIYNFDYAHGANPVGGLLQDKSGNLYGNVAQGGQFDDGAVFELVKG